MSAQLLMGNEAIALAALHSGINLACGYPGTPSTEIIETIVRHNPGDVHVEWSVNEKVALELAIGASYAGMRALVTMKQVGLNVASDALMSFVYVGAKGGLVLVVADDPGPISSQTEQDTRQFAQFAHLPVFDPVSPEQAAAMIPAAFELSERYRTPVIVRPTTRIDHGCAVIDLPKVLPGTRHPVSGFVKDPSFVIFPKRSYQGHLEIIERLEQIADEFSDSEFNVFTPWGEGEATIGVVSSGNNDGYLHEALLRLAQLAGQAGVKMPALRLLAIGTPFPFPERLAREFTRGLTRIICFEELEPVLEREFIMLAGRYHLPYDVHGKLDRSTSLAGENSVEIIAGQLAAFLGLEAIYAPWQAELVAASVPVELPVRPPTLCAGCPHRGAFLAVKQAIGTRRKVIYSGDIGCYTLGNAAPLKTTDTCLCMGAGITMAQGLGLAEPDTIQIAFIGDSTFFASGMTGVANAVYNRHHLCICVLDNATTAMTGLQPDPATGLTLMGTQSKPISIKAVLTALGVTTILVVDPLDLAASKMAVDAALTDPGVSAVIFESPCIQLEKPLAPVNIVADRCREKCKACVQRLGCPALTIDNALAVVDESLCTGCDLCVSLCPWDAITSPRLMAATAGGAHD